MSSAETAVTWDTWLEIVSLTETRRLVVQVERKLLPSSIRNILPSWQNWVKLLLRRLVDLLVLSTTMALKAMALVLLPLHRLLR